MGHRLLHNTGALDYLGQEHLAVTKEVANHAHPVHQRAFNDFNRAFGTLPTGFRVFNDVVGDALDEGVLHSLLNRPLAPGQIFFLGLAALAAIALGNFQQAVGAVVTAIEHHVLNQLFQFRIDLVVDHELAGVDDAHVHAGLDGVVQEHRVDGFTHGIVAAERERHVADTAGNGRMGQVVANPAAGVDEIHRVIVVLLDTSGDGEDIGVENDIAGGEADTDEEIVGALADLRFTFKGIRLAVLIEGHDHDGGAVAHAVTGTLEELLLAFLQADGVHHCLALYAAQAGFDDLPFGGINHDRNAGDVGFRGDQIEERHHDVLRIQHALIHVDVDDLGTVFYLVAGDAEGLFVLLLFDQPQESLGARHVCALTHVDEQGVLVTRKRFKAGQPQRGFLLWYLSWRVFGNRFRDGFDMVRA